MFEETTATGLGIASIAIGATEIAAPEKLQEIMGISNGENTGIMRVLGVREICHGIDILAHKDPTPGIWARCAGDMLDGVLLGVVADKTNRPGGFAAIAAAVLPGGLAGIDTCVQVTVKR